MGTVALYRVYSTGLRYMQGSPRFVIQIDLCTVSFLYMLGRCLCFWLLLGQTHRIGTLCKHKVWIKFMRTLFYVHVRILVEVEVDRGEVGGWGRVPFSRNLMSPTPRRKWYLTTGRRFH